MRVVFGIGLAAAAVTLMVVWPLPAVLSFAAAGLIALWCGWERFLDALDHWLDKQELKDRLRAMDNDYAHARRRMRAISRGDYL